jgi:hypothetical protein
MRERGGGECTGFSGAQPGVHRGDPIPATVAESLTDVHKYL